MSAPKWRLKLCETNPKRAPKTIIKVPVTDKTKLCKHFIYLTHTVNERKRVQSQFSESYQSTRQKEVQKEV